MNRRLLVVGASRGMGFGIASRMCSKFSKTVGLSRTPLSDCPFTSLAFDVRNLGDWTSLEREVEENECFTDMIYVAGTCSVFQIDDEDAPGKYQDTIDSNLTGAFYALRFFRRQFCGEAGNIIIIGSHLAENGAAGFSAYAASKHGLMGLMKSLTLEFAPLGIRLNMINPGWVDTQMASRIWEQLQVSKEQIEASIPSKKVVHVDEVAELVEFILLNSSSSMNGATINLDGAMRL